MHKLISDDKLWEIFDTERKKACEGVDAEVGTPEWNVAAGKIDVINSICGAVTDMNAAERTPTDEAKKPIWKEGISVVHSDYADGHGETARHGWAEWTCPVCGWFVGEQFIPSWTKHKAHNQRKSNFCSRCGQRIDWE